MKASHKATVLKAIPMHATTETAASPGAGDKSAQSLPPQEKMASWQAVHIAMRTDPAAVKERWSEIDNVKKWRTGKQHTNTA